MQWFTSDQIRQRSDMINGREYIKTPLEAYAETQPVSEFDTVTRTYVSIVNDCIVAEGNLLLNIPLTEHTTFLDACYDQVNRLNCAYIEGGDLKLYWYDPVAASFVTTNFGPAERCYLFMDDLRYWAPATTGNSNWLIYERDSALYIRVQDDRYQTEELITELRPDEHLAGAGMNKQYRVQLVLQRETVTDAVQSEADEIYVYTIDDIAIDIAGSVVIHEA